MYLKTRALLAALTALSVAGVAMGQSARMADPDLLGIKPGMAKSAALAMLKEKFPTSKTAIVKKGVAIGTADVYYDALYRITLDKLKPSVADDTLIISFLPDDTVLGLRRIIHYVPNKQTTGDVYTVLKQKYGDPVYFVYDDTTRFADQAMWSNTMLPGLTLIGASYVQGGVINSSDFGTVTPYPFCSSEMSTYVGDLYDPKGIYEQLTDRSDFARKRVNQWKSCGKALWVENRSERHYPFTATYTEIMLVDLARAPDQFLDLPAMLKKNPATLYAKPVTSLPKPSADTPSF